MISKPLVSIIIAFLNAEEFIPEAIESVLAQTYDHWELLLVDDGSTDSSTKISLRYAERYPDQVCYFEHDDHQNRGVCVSRNLGIRNAKGKYIALLDADDVWLPHKLEQQVAIMESQPGAAAVFGRSLYWQSWTGNPENHQKDYMPELGVQPNTLFQPPILFTLCYPLGKAGAPCPSDLLLRRKILERIGGFEEDFPRAYQLYEDQAFLSKVYLTGAVFIASQCWIRYRLHPDSCTSKVYQVGQYHTIRLFFLNWLERYLTKQNVKDPQLWNALRKALWPYRHPILYRLSNLPQWIGRHTLPIPVRNWLKGNLLGALK